MDTPEKVLYDNVESLLQELAIMALRAAFGEAWSRDTSSDEKGWTPDNPSYGHCVIALLFAEEVLGRSEYLRYDLSGTPYADMRSHYKLRLANGSVVDFTENQFRQGVPDWNKLDMKVRIRKELLDPSNKSNESTIRRYRTFRDRVIRALQAAGAVV